MECERRGVQHAGNHSLVVFTPGDVFEGLGDGDEAIVLLRACHALDDVSSGV